MLASAQTSESTNILSGKLGSPGKKGLDGSHELFPRVCSWPANNIPTKNKAKSDDARLLSQGSSVIRTCSDSKMGGTYVPSKAGTEATSASVTFVDKSGTWGSLENSPCSENVFAEGSSSYRHVNDLELTSAVSKRLIPSLYSLETAKNNAECKSFDYLRIGPNSLTPAPLVANSSKSDLHRVSSKEVKNRLSWGEEVMISILGKDPNDFVHTFLPESSEDSPMLIAGANSKTSFHSSGTSPKLKTRELDCEMNPLAFWKDNARKTFFRDRNLENRMSTKKRYAVSQGLTSSNDGFSSKVVKTKDPAARVTCTEIDSKIGRPSCISYELSDSKNVITSSKKLSQNLCKLPDIASNFKESYDNFSRNSSSRDRSALNNNKSKSLESSSPRSNISKIFDSEPQTKERSTDSNHDFNNPSTVSIETASSATSIIATSAEEGTKFQKDVIYPFSTECLETAAEARNKGKLTSRVDERKQMLKREGSQQYLRGSNYPTQRCLQSGRTILYSYPVNGGFIAPRATAPLLCVPGHERHHPMLYTLPAGSPMIVGQPLFSQIFCGLPGQHPGLYYSPVYHQLPVQFQLPKIYQQPVIQHYTVDKLDQQVTVNLPLTTENVNMHNKASGANAN